MINDFQIENGILTLNPGTEYMEAEKFAERDDIFEVILPDGLRHISMACFTSCNNLRKVNIPSTVEVIDDGAFLMCESLAEIFFPDGLKSINDLAFQSTMLEKITVPESVTHIGEEAFFDCVNLREANVLNPECEILGDGFGSCENLIRGYIAPGYPAETLPGTELLYSLLWAGCPEKHSETTSKRAESFIRNNETLVMERILKYNNVCAMTGISSRKLLDVKNIDKYVKQTTLNKQTELTTLLIKAKGENRMNMEEFEL